MGTSTGSFDLVGALEVLASVDPDRCTVAPSPELNDRIRQEVTRLEGTKRVKELTARVKIPEPKSPGLNDGLIIPGSYFPLGTSIERVRSAAADRAPLHGTLRVIVVLVDFSDQVMAETLQHFEELFFSTGVLANGSVKEYFDEVTNGLVTITGQVVGPYRMPRTMAQYAHGESGTGSAAPNARTMARDAAVAANPSVELRSLRQRRQRLRGRLHRRARRARRRADRRSRRHLVTQVGLVRRRQYLADTTKIYAYLTVPEDARIGVCAHELGHLLFGFPDLYDTDNTSEGIGNWCLMAGGSWNGGGDIPAHPSAWCKANQGWVTVQNVTTNGLAHDGRREGQPHGVPAVEGRHGRTGVLPRREPPEERLRRPPPGRRAADLAHRRRHRQQHRRNPLSRSRWCRPTATAIWRTTPTVATPVIPSRDPRTIRAFTKTSTPNSKSYGGLNTCVSLTAISDSGPVMTAQVQVQCGKSRTKDTKDTKDGRKEVKEQQKDQFKEKDFYKELIKEKDFKDRIKEKDLKEIRERGWPDKPWDGKFVDTKLADGMPADGGVDRPYGASTAGPAALEARVAALEAALFGEAEPFIGADLRPDLRDSALADEADVSPSGPLPDKRSFDSKPPEAG